MAKAIPPLVRRQIVELCQSGKSARQVSEELGLGYPGVAKVWRQFRTHGSTALLVRYDRCGRKSQYDAVVRSQIDQMLSQNEYLGAPIIRSRLLAQGVLPQVPHERTIQRWWKAAGKSKSRGRRPPVNRSYDRRIHGTWQIDAKENVELDDESRHCYLSFADEATCTFLRGHVFPRKTPDPTG